MEGNFTFGIGETALDAWDKEVVILKKALRPEHWYHREQYLVKRESFWGTKEEWVLQVHLTKLV